MTVSKIRGGTALSLAVALWSLGTALAPATASAEGAPALMTAPMGQSVKIDQAPPSAPPALPVQGGEQEPATEQPEQPKYELLPLAMAGPNARVVADALGRVTPSVGPLEFPRVEMEGLVLLPDGRWDIIPTMNGQASRYLQAIAAHHGLVATFFRNIYADEGDDIAREVGLPQNNGGKAGNGAVMRLNAQGTLMAVQWGVKCADPTAAYMKLAAWPNGLQMVGKPKPNYTRKAVAPMEIVVPPGRTAFLRLTDFQMALGSMDGVVLSRSKVNKDARPPGGRSIYLNDAASQGVLVYK